MYSICVMLLECMCSGLTVWHWVESTRLSLAQAIYPALDIPQFPALWAFLSFSMFVVVALVVFCESEKELLLPLFSFTKAKVISLFGLAAL